MRRGYSFLPLILFLLVSVTHLHARQQRVANTSAADPLIQQMISLVSGDSILANIRRLESFGTRYETTLQRDSAAAWIFNSFNGTAATVESDTFSYAFVDYRSLDRWGRDAFWVIGQDTRDKQNYLLFTVDGGLHWTLQSPPKAAALMAVDFVDSATGWIAGSGGSVFRTTNYGFTWKQQSSGVPNDLNDIGFVNNQLGVAVGDGGILLRTSDAGSTWTQMNSGVSSNLRKLKAIGDRQLWADGNAGTILHSADGGLSWAPQRSGVTRDLTSLDFADSLRGWAFGAMATLLNTSDGGQTWMVVPVPPDMKRDSSGTNTSVCVLDSMSTSVISDGEIWKISGDGQTWKKMANVGSHAIRVLGGDSLLTYGGVAGICRSTDGGSNWQAWDAKVPRNLYGTSRNCVVTISGLVTPAKECLLVAHYDTPSGDNLGADDNATGVAVAMEVMRVLKSHRLQSTIRFIATSGNAVGLLGSNHYVTLAKSLGRKIAFVANLDMLGYPVLGDTTRIVVGSYERRSAYADSTLAYNSMYGLGMRIDPFIDSVGEGDSYSFDFAGYQTLHFSEGSSQEILLGNPYAFKPSDRSDKLNQQMLTRAAQLIVGLTASFGGHVAGLSKPWVWKTPYTRWSDLRGLAVVNSNIAYAVGDFGTIIKSTDGGLTWTQQVVATSVSLRSAWFTDANHGVVVGDWGTLLRTTNGGASWSLRTFESTSIFYGVCFNDFNTGCAVGDKGVFYQTYDGGATWTKRILTSEMTITSVSFVDNNTGYFVGSLGSIFRTTDGGTKWSRQVSGIESFDAVTLLGVAFADANTGIAVGEKGTILRSTDGGANWNLPMQLGSRANIHAVQFKDALTGFAVCDGGVILMTTDGGLTWTEQFNASTSWLSDIRIIDSKHVIAAGTDGLLVRTNDGGLTWKYLNEGPRLALYGVHYSNPGVGVVVVGYLGGIFSTVDGGASWNARVSGTTNTLRGVDFPTPDIGIAVGDFGTILRTTDGGVTWNDISIKDPIIGSTLMLTAISMPTPSAGLIVGRIDSLVGTVMVTRSLILRSVDAGQNWVRISPPRPDDRELFGVTFGGVTTVTIVGSTGLIARSTNAGLTWVAQSGIPDPEHGGAVPPPNNRLMGVAFSGPNRGYAVGELGIILGTSNGGESWVKQKSITSGDLNAVSTIDGVNVLTAGAGGVVLVSNSSGYQWNLGSINSVQDLNAMQLTDIVEGTIVGNRGEILRTTLGIPTGIAQPFASATPPDQFVLNQNYPNPFNGTTAVSYQLPAPSGVEGSALSLVSLKVYDILGREVATLVNGLEPPGVYVVRWDSKNLPSGVYFYKLNVGDMQVTKKMVLLK